MCPSKRSSFAHASSRIESRTFTAQVRVVDDPRRAPRRSRSGARRRPRRVVQEVLLELVEDDEQRPRLRASTRAASRRASRRGVGQRLAPASSCERVARPPRQRRASGRRATSGTTQTANGASLGPGARLLAQAVHDARLQQRALADAARPVDDRQPRRRAGWRSTIAVSCERPKKKPASSSPYGTSPTYGLSRAARAVVGASRGDGHAESARPPASRQLRLELLHVLAQLAVDELDVLALVPERLLDLAHVRVGRLALHRPRLADELARRPRSG